MEFNGDMAPVSNFVTFFFHPPSLKYPEYATILTYPNPTESIGIRQSHAMPKK